MLENIKNYFKTMQKWKILSQEGVAKKLKNCKNKMTFSRIGLTKNWKRS